MDKNISNSLCNGKNDNKKFYTNEDFIGDVLATLERFTVWEAENCHSEKDIQKYNDKAIECLEEIRTYELKLFED